MVLILFVFTSAEGQEINVKEEYKKIYLASYPRAGNHWVRYLIEEVTGVVTSSVYCDPDPQHLPSLFPWNGYVVDHGYEGNRRYPEKGEVVVLKTHYPAIMVGDPYHEPPQGKTIRIIRHPIDSIYSYYLAFSTPENPPVSPIPQEFLLKAIDSWRTYQEFWNDRPNVLSFRYEDLMDHPFRYLKKVMMFVGFRGGEDKLRAAVAKYPPNNIFLKHAVHYTKDQLDLIAKELGPLLVKFNYPIL